MKFWYYWFCFRMRFDDALHALGMHLSYWWFSIRFALFWMLMRTALRLIPERNEDWFLELLRDRPDRKQEVHEA